MQILIIAAMHGAPVLLVPFIHPRSSTLNIVTGVMCIVAIVTGSLSYVILDIAGIFLAYLIAQSFLEREFIRNRDVIEKKEEARRNDPSEFIADFWPIILIILIIIIAVGFGSGGGGSGYLDGVPRRLQ